MVNRAKAWKEIEKDAQVEERKKMGVMSVSAKRKREDEIEGTVIEDTGVSEREREGDGGEWERGSDKVAKRKQIEEGEST